jgi:predicted nucleotidyltransferase
MAEIASLDDLRLRFGTSTPRRQFLFRQLDIIIDQLCATRELKRVFLVGSFVSGKASPNDVDLLVVMNAGFSTTQFGGKVLELFQHDLCRIRYHADLFWVTEAVGKARIDDLLEVFSRDRDGRAQSVIEVNL